MSDAKIYEEDKILQIWNCYRKLNTDERKELEENIECLAKIRKQYFSSYYAKQKKFLSFEDIVEIFVCTKENPKFKVDYECFPTLPTEIIADVTSFIRLNFSTQKEIEAKEYSRILQALTIRFTIRVILKKLSWQGLNKYLQLFKMTQKIKKRTDSSE